MTRHQEPAYAKLNLTLDVLERRPDGYHEMDMLMLSVDLEDTVSAILEEHPGLKLQCSRGDLPVERGNLAYDAAALYGGMAGLPAPGVHLHLQKRIPLSAGMAGGSTDAAAVLRLLNRLAPNPLGQHALTDLAQTLGSDVPYCLTGGLARARGRGEILTPLPPFPNCPLVLCKPDFPVSTTELFHRLDAQLPTRHPDTRGMLKALADGDLHAIGALLFNVFEDILPQKARETVSGIRTKLLELGALGASMSGTGATVFGIFEEESRAAHAAAVLREQFRSVFLVHASPAYR
jgi:4-diphosphocytidyl-2-C-methyl-D-erythritol kinase